QELHLVGTAWLDEPIAILGSLAALALAWILFPATTLLMLGLFLDGVIASVERRHYPGLPPPRSIGVIESLAGMMRLVLLAIVINVAVLPLYIVPGINFFIYYLLNGYFVGREYFELVALRRLDRDAARAMWRRHRGQFVLAGVVIAFLLSLPLLNLAAPVLAATFLLHMFEELRSSMTAERIATRRRSGLIDG
ncbi:MAG TPA: EI24 domain-containing protein, partial [Stellaceae bacterium]|nr:EI24 domain-containing protein [Stellaceae bacterium]